MRTTLSEEELREIVHKTVHETLGNTLSESGSSYSTEKQQPNQGMVDRPVVAISTDHGGVDLKALLKQDLINQGFEVIDCGTDTKESVDYPDFALAVAELVANGKAWRGVMIDGAGIGSCMAANKVPGVRAAMCYDYATAVNSREHNNANVLTLGASMLSSDLAQSILKVWLNTEFGGGRHARRIDKIAAIEMKYLSDGK